MFAAMLTRTGLLLARMALPAALALLAPTTAYAQIDSDPLADRRIETINVTIVNPSTDEALNQRIIDEVRRAAGVFPSDRYKAETVFFGLAQTRRNSRILSAVPTASPGPTGGVDINVAVTLADGNATGAKPRFPILYDENGTILKAKLEILAMGYLNNDAWYGRPDALLNGNPLVEGRTAGRGTQVWSEGFVQTGLYGITPISPAVQFYGGASVIASGSIGRELFTDKTRGHVAVEDAFIGIVGGTTSASGDRFVANLSFGRMRFSIGDGFLIANTASNGSNRAALQSNPRWAADLLALGQLKYNSTKLEFFFLDPDELPAVDSKTQLVGVNLETRLKPGLDLGVTWLHVTKSTFGYFTPTDQFSRDGLDTYSLRVRFQPKPKGLFVAGELARQTNGNFDMRATAYQTEIGWVFANAPVTLSYRYARHSGDDPATTRFERWDPLFSGGNGEQWVQGINHFKVFQDSNNVAHRVQARVRPSPRTELVPQLWLFRSDTLQNIGGNPGLSTLPSHALGKEANLTAKRFISSNLMVQGHIAATWPGAAVKQTLSTLSDPWISAMVFVRLGF